MSIRKMFRREFLSKSAKTVVVAGFAGTTVRFAQDEKPAGTSKEQADKKAQPEFRVLGKTGLKVTTVSYGAMRTRDEAIIHRALDLGINYIDTARVYMGGQNEVTVGNVMKTRRKEVFVATKFVPASTEDILKSVETSLKSLQMDYVDVIQAHGLDTVEQLKDESILEALRKVKKEGKARFVGFTTHKNMTELVKAAISMKFYDTILVAYNFKSSPELTTAIEDAAKAGIGIVAMKTQAGGYTDTKMGELSPHQAALKWVLQNKGIANTIPSMVNYDQLSEDIQVMGSKMGWMDRKTLYRYSQAIDKTYCRMCGKCSGLCPKGVDVQDVNRSIMYHEGYRDAALAMTAYQSIPSKSRPSACQTCESCSVQCAYGLNIHGKMRRAATLFV